MENLSVQLTQNPKEKPAKGAKLGFGSVFTDHMLLMDYDKGIGWHDARIVPYGPISISLAATCLHYAQETFEGMKAYRAEDGRVLLFRPEENFKRMNISNERMCIPQLDVDFCLNALKKLVWLERDWIPEDKESSLYLRPMCIGVESKLGVKDADNYLFAILCSPSGPYYATGLKPVKIYVEEQYVRAVRGGVGFAKTGGNYACSMLAQSVAHEKGYAQVLWLDGVEKKYIGEVGAMNIFFVIDGEIVTPELDGSILSGITRKSIIELLRHEGYRVTERKLSIQEVAESYRCGKLQEVFGSGTAAVISPVGELKWGDEVMIINNNEIGPISAHLYQELTDIQWGRVKGPEGWSVEVKE
ncbi:MAG: branched-chain amino acid aminotransferase [Lachnospiraceae bacterium]|nr:branched-chain amino acid aminotransferase [Lachnospiraceae bacterium]